MKLITFNDYFNITLISIYRKNFLLLKTNSLGILYFLIPKKQKVVILKNAIIFYWQKKTSLLNLFQKIKNNSNIKIKKKLIIYGLGYKIYNKLHLNNSLEFKFGFSHHKLVFITNKKIEINFFKLKRISNKINVIITGYDYNVITNTAALIKNLVKKNIYKNTGIFYKNEKIVLKKIKKK